METDRCQLCQDMPEGPDDGIHGPGDCIPPPLIEAPNSVGDKHVGSADDCANDPIRYGD